MTTFLKTYQAAPAVTCLLLLIAAACLALDILIWGIFRDIGWSGFSKLLFAIALVTQACGLIFLGKLLVKSLEN